MTEHNAGAENTEKDAVRILLYSDNRNVRREVIDSLGVRLGANMPKISWTEAATWQGAELKVREGKFDLMILDAEASKLGGIGLGMKIRDEINPDIPYIVLIARPQDEWLARVAKPAAVLFCPVNPRELAVTVREVLKKH